MSTPVVYEVVITDANGDTNAISRYLAYKNALEVTHILQHRIKPGYVVDIVKTPIHKSEKDAA